MKTFQRIAAIPAQRLIVALAAVHAAPATAITPHLGRPRPSQPPDHHRRTRPTLGELSHQTLLAWLVQRRITWPKTPNRHVLINAKTALGTGPVSAEYLKRHLLHQGVYLERIRGAQRRSRGWRRCTPLRTRAGSRRGRRWQTDRPPPADPGAACERAPNRASLSGPWCVAG